MRETGEIKADILAREFPSHPEIFCNKEQLYVGVGVDGVGAEEGKDMIQFVFFRKPPQIIVKVRLEKIQLVGKDPREEFF